MKTELVKFVEYWSSTDYENLSRDTIIEYLPRNVSVTSETDLRNQETGDAFFYKTLKKLDPNITSTELIKIYDRGTYVEDLKTTTIEYTILEKDNDIIIKYPIPDQKHISKRDRTWGNWYNNVLSALKIKYEQKEPKIVVEELEKTNSANNEINGVKVKTHTRIQYQLLKLGSDMGFNVFSAVDDTKKIEKLSPIKNCNAIRPEFTSNNEINKTLKRVDVVWIKDEKIIALIEIEDTTNIEHSVVKLHELSNADPNINIRIYIVAPDDKEAKISKTFKIKAFKDLNIKYIRYSKLNELLESSEKYSAGFKPKILDIISDNS